jgi:3D (Asp-Asp-Asp) domain-containing protein
MIKHHLVSTGVILALISSNIIIGNSYINSNKEYENKIKKQSEVIQKYKVNKKEQNELIESKVSDIEDLQIQLNHQVNKVNSLSNQLDQSNKEKATLQERLSKLKYFEVTAYTAGYESTQKSKGDIGYGITASGTTVKEGKTIACPPSLKFGTKLNIEGVGLRVCEDRGGAIKAEHIDLYVDSVSEALDFGRKKLLVEIIN